MSSRRRQEQQTPAVPSQEATTEAVAAAAAESTPVPGVTPAGAFVRPDKAGKWSVKRAEGYDETFDVVLIQGSPRNRANGTYMSGRIHPGDVWTYLGESDPDPNAPEIEEKTNGETVHD
jgi:hypothetical protein